MGSEGLSAVAGRWLSQEPVWGPAAWWVGQYHSDLDRPPPAVGEGVASPQRCLLTPALKCLGQWCP